eukprot:s55_g44.t1
MSRTSFASLRSLRSERHPRPNGAKFVRALYVLTIAYDFKRSTVNCDGFASISSFNCIHGEYAGRRGVSKTESRDATERAVLQSEFGEFQIRPGALLLRFKDLHWGAQARRSDMCGHQRATSAGGKSGGRRSEKSEKSDTQQGLVNDVLAQQYAGRLRRRRTSGQSFKRVCEFTDASCSSEGLELQNFDPAVCFEEQSHP